MNEKTVRYTIDLENPPELTPEQRDRLRALSERPDSEIDYSDIPPLTEKFWTNGIRNPFFHPLQTSNIVRIDSDVLDWLRAQGEGYQARLNAILRREMLATIKPATE